MKIEKIYIEGYRNLKKYSTEFDPKINFIYGENAQGKTNLIEAIWMFTGARSFRGTKDADLVNFEKDSAKIKGDFFFENRNQEIAVFFDKSKRKIFLNTIFILLAQQIIFFICSLIVASPDDIIDDLRIDPGTCYQVLHHRNGKIQ